MLTTVPTFRMFLLWSALAVAACGNGSDGGPQSSGGATASGGTSASGGGSTGGAGGTSASGGSSTGGTGGTSSGLKTTGEPCTSNGDCASFTAGSQGTCKTDWPQGYCTETCNVGQCTGADSTCRSYQSQMMCLVRCAGDQDCRQGYVCDISVYACVPG